MTRLVLGPLLRFVGLTEATIWVETETACEVEILGARVSTFCVEGHHFALVMLKDLEPGSSTTYDVALDGVRAWPPADSPYPAPVLRTFREEEPVELVFGSCRVALPHEPPYTLPKETDPRGRGFDALHALARSLLDGESPAYPDLLFLCGDQVYADEVSPHTREFISTRDDRPSQAPTDQVADFEEYTRLYEESWGDPVIRWLLSTVSTSMVIDDHDMHDDWSISRAWCEQMDRLPWWRERLVSGLMSYWLYQYIGNLSPSDLSGDELWQRVSRADDPGAELRTAMAGDTEKQDGRRWSYFRDLGTTRLVVIDVRSGRCLDEGGRTIVDDDEWDWIVQRATEREVDHLLIGSSAPWLLLPTFHHLEAWNERVCAGGWGALAARLGERMRQGLDFDHWAAFGRSFGDLSRLLAEIGAGLHGRAPATIGVLSGDVHHAYLAEVAFRREAGVRSTVYQAVCSPYRNALDTKERRVVQLAGTRSAAAVARGLAAAAGVAAPDIRWRLCEGPCYDNQVATLQLDGPEATLKLEKVPRDTAGRDERLELTFERRLS